VEASRDPRVLRMTEEVYLMDAGSGRLPTGPWRGPPLPARKLSRVFREAGEGAWAGPSLRELASRLS